MVNFVMQHQELQEVIKIPVNLKILMVLWWRKPMQLQRSGGASIATLYHYLTAELLHIYQDTHPEVGDAAIDHLRSDLQTLALVLMQEGVAQTTVDRAESILGHFPRAYLESGLLQRNG